MQWCFIIVILLLGTILCHCEVSDEHFVNNLTALHAFENISNRGIPSVDDVQKTIQRKCEKNGGPNAFEQFGAATDYLQECIKSNFNLTQIQDELNRSRKNGSMDEVIVTHCYKIPVLRQCIGKVAVALDRCLDEEEKSSLNIFLNITDILINFVCDKEGDRVAMFVAGGGFECLQSKKQHLETCVSETLDGRITSNFSDNSLPSLRITNDSCRDYKNLQGCVVSTLETCEDDTPANIIDALFKYILRITPCNYQPTSDFATHQRFLRSAESLNSLNDVFYQVKQKYESQCLKNGGQVAAEKFHETLDQVNNCSKLMHYNLMIKIKEVKGVPFEYLCNGFRLGIRDCLSTVSLKMGDCSSPEEEYAPKFGIDLYDSLFNFYCKDDARALKKIFTEKDICMNKIHNSTRFCLNKTKYIEVHAKDNVVTKSELCGDLKILRSCFLDIAAQQCSNNAHTNEFIVGLSDAVFKPCNGVRIFVSNLLLFVMILLNSVNTHT